MLNLLELTDVVVEEVAEEYADALLALETALKKLAHLRKSVESSHACLSREIQEPLRKSRDLLSCELFQLQCGKFRLAARGIDNMEISNWTQKSGPAN
jgi:hypothetical protein